MNVLIVSPGFPGEMPHFTRGLAQVGARVVGVGDQPASSIPEPAKSSLSGYVHAPSLWDEPRVIDLVRGQLRHVQLDRIECLWEPAMLLAARLREALGVPGMGVEQTTCFRDKERMKQALDAAGIRTPWHRRARSAAECRAAAEEVGFPLIVKPIDGAGARDTHRIESRAELERAISRLGHLSQVSVEEYIEGEELTFDTVCAEGRILFENVSFYWTRPIEERKHEWVSPCSVCLRDIDVDALAPARRMGRAVLAALGFRTGFSHMEWYRKRDGEVVFGEIGGRPPGARLVDAMNYACDVDLFAGWAEAVCHGRLSQPVHRRYNAAIISKRAEGQGRIQRVEGLETLRRELGPTLVAAHVQPIGTPRGDWRGSAVADGWMIVRHPDLQRTFEIVERAAQGLRIIAT
jgi:hypothetical protein